MIITIVGAGNSGCANAFIAAENGHEVRILKTTRGTAHDEHFEKMQKNGGLWGIDNTKSDKYTDFADEGEKTFQKIAMITRDPQEAIEGADGCVWHRIVEMILNPRRHPLNTENPTFDSFERCAI
jgi:opine dehydrogenase